MFGKCSIFGSPPCPPPSCSWNLQREKLFFFLKEKSKKPSAGLVFSPFPFSWVIVSLSFSLCVCVCTGVCVCVCVCVFALDTRRVLSGPGAARLGLPTFVLNEKETHSNERFSPRPRGSCWVAWLVCTLSWQMRKTREQVEDFSSPQQNTWRPAGP